MAIAVFVADISIFKCCRSPSMPTTKLISDISSLLNMAALRSRTVGFVACQFGSPVSMVNIVFGMVNEMELCAPGDVIGDDGILDGCVTCMSSRCVCELFCAPVDKKWLPYGSSTKCTTKKIKTKKHRISDLWAAGDGQTVARVYYMALS